MQTLDKGIDRLSFEKVLYFPEHVKALVENRETYPIHMQIGPVNFCNHDCTFCYAARSMFDAQGVNRSRIHVERLMEIVEEMTPLGLKAATLVGSGEPTLHPRLDEIIVGLRQRGVEVGMFSNGSCLTDKLARAIVDHMTFVRFSMTGASREVHDLVHANSDFDRVVSNIRQIASMRKGPLPTLGVQFVLASYSAQDLVRGARLARDMGMDYYEIKPCYVAPNKPDQLPNTLSIADADALIAEAMTLETDTFKIYGKSEQMHTVFTNLDDRAYHDCPGHKTTAVLEADLNLYICVNQKIAGYCFGNLEKTSFRDVWHGNRRQEVLRDLNVHYCVPRCRQDPLNRLVHEIRIGERTIPLDLPRPTEDMHVNFL